MGLIRDKVCRALFGVGSGTGSSSSVISLSSGQLLPIVANMNSLGPLWENLDFRYKKGRGQESISKRDIQ